MPITYRICCLSIFATIGAQPLSLLKHISKACPHHCGNSETRSWSQTAVSHAKLTHAMERLKQYLHGRVQQISPCFCVRHHSHRVDQSRYACMECASRPCIPVSSQSSGRKAKSRVLRPVICAMSIFQDGRSTLGCLPMQ